MFKAYSKKNDGDKNDSSSNKKVTREEEEKERLALEEFQKRKKVDQFNKDVEREKEGQAYRSVSGYSDDDDDDEDNYPTSSQKAAAELVRNIVENNTKKGYSSFPSKDEKPEIDNRKRHKKYKKEKKTKKRRKRDRRHSSSSSSSSSEESDSVKPIPSSTIDKWSFLSKTDYDRHFVARYSVWDNSRCLANLTTYDKLAERETAHTRPFFKAIIGAPERWNKVFYPDEEKRNAVEKKFHQLLEKFAKHEPQERRFRERTIPSRSESGFVPLSMNPYVDLDQLTSDSAVEAMKIDLGKNSERVNVSSLSKGEVIRAKTLSDRRVELNKIVTRDPNNTDAWIDFLKNEDDNIDLIKKITPQYNQDDLKAYRMRKEEIVKKAVELNPLTMELHMIRLENKRAMHCNPAEIEKEFKNILMLFPHEQLVWQKYLDFVQYESYSSDKMEKAFKLCLQKLCSLLDRTMLSHIDRVTDPVQLRRAYLSFYIRYLQWLMASSNIPVALANVQASFELNIGAGTEKLDYQTRDRIFSLQQFWNTNLPRIGDAEGEGSKITFNKNHGMKEDDKQKLEFPAHQLLRYKMGDAVDKSLFRKDKSLGENWAELERQMEDLDGAPKRFELEFEEDDTDSTYLRLINLHDPVTEDLLTPYVARKNDGVDFIQPLLETIGAKFAHPTLYAVTTEQILSEWKAITEDVKMEEIAPFTPSTPRSSCRKLALSIIRHLRDNTYDQNENMKEKLTIAELLTLLEQRESDMGNSLILDMITEELGEQSSVNLITCENEKTKKIISAIFFDKLTKWIKKAELEINEEIPLMRKNMQKTVRKLAKLIMSQIVNPVVPAESELLKWQLHLFGLSLMIQLMPDVKSKIRIFVDESLRRVSEVSGNYTVDAIELAYERAIKFKELEMGIIMKEQYLPLPTTLCQGLGFFLAVVSDNSYAACCLDQDFSPDCDEEQSLKELVNSYLLNVITARNRNIPAADIRFLYQFGIMAISVDEMILRDNKALYRKILDSAYEHYGATETWVLKKWMDERYAGPSKIILKIELNEAKKKCVVDENRQTDIFWKHKQLRYTVAQVYSAAVNFNTVRDTTTRVSQALTGLLRATRQHAMEANDVTIWRMAMRVASWLEEVDDFRSLDEMHVLAYGVCNWSKDIHLDRVMYQHDEMTFQNVMRLLLESRMHLFIDDKSVVETFKEKAQQELCIQEHSQERLESRDRLRKETSSSNDSTTKKRQN